MERDFIGLVGRNSRPSLMQENFRALYDSVRSAVHWPFLDRTSSLQKIMSFETSGEDKHKKSLLEPLFSTGLQPAASVDAFKATTTVCSVNSTEESLGMERHGATQFSTPCFNDDSFTAMSSHSSIPIAMTSPSLKSNGISNGTIPTATEVACSVKTVVGSFTPRNAEKPQMKNDKLTIFYAGSVNVYDDVPSHVAQEIMLMASRECKTGICSGHPRSDSLCKGRHSCSEIKTGIEPGLADDTTGAKSIVDLILNSKNEPARTIDTSVPQARKASLVRFLQKRKERVSSKMPYSFEKKSPERCIVLEGAPASSKFSTTDGSIFSNSRSGSWHAGQSKSSSDSDESPSTKLEM